jgi:hypothetical protein
MRINRFALIIAAFFMLFANVSFAQIADSRCDPVQLKMIEAEAAANGSMVLHIENHGTAPLLDPKVFPEKSGINFAQLFTGPGPGDSNDRAALYKTAAGVMRMAYGVAYFEKNTPDPDFYGAVVDKVIAGRFQRHVLPCGTKATATVYKATRGRNGVTTIQTIRNLVLGYNSAGTIIEAVNGKQSFIQDHCGNLVALENVVVTFQPIAPPAPPVAAPTPVPDPEPIVREAAPQPEPRAELPLPPRPPAPAEPTIAPVPEPVPVPVQVAEVENGGPSFMVGVGLIVGSFRTEYDFPDPKKGNVPQHHSFKAPVIVARFDQSPSQGVFVAAMFTIGGSTSNMKFDTSTESGVVKKRDEENSRDEIMRLKAGYKFPVGDVLSIGVSINFDRQCLCEKYVAQNTDTTTKRTIKTTGIGIEASGSTDSEDHKVTVRVGGTIGIAGNRTKWTEQVYHGPPPINFPRVEDTKEDAKMNALEGEVDVQVAGPVSIFANARWNSVKSIRPVAHTAGEKTSSKSAMVGVGFNWGK